MELVNSRAEFAVLGCKEEAGWLAVSSGFIGSVVGEEFDSVFEGALRGVVVEGGVKYLAVVFLVDKCVEVVHGLHVEELH